MRDDAASIHSAHAQADVVVGAFRGALLIAHRCGGRGRGAGVAPDALRDALQEGYPDLFPVGEGSLNLKISGCRE